MLSLRQPCLGGIALHPDRWLGSVETGLLGFCSLAAFSASSEGPSKNRHTQTSGPELRSSSLLSSLNPPGQFLFLYVRLKTAASHGACPQCLSQRSSQGPGCVPAFCTSKTASGRGLACTPAGPGSCLGAALKPFPGHYHSGSFCLVPGTGHLRSHLISLSRSQLMEAPSPFCLSPGRFTTLSFMPWDRKCFSACRDPDIYYTSG